jgi:hypothetical protein
METASCQGLTSRSKAPKQICGTVRLFPDCGGILYQKQLAFGLLNVARASPLRGQVFQWQARRPPYNKAIKSRISGGTLVLRNIIAQNPAMSDSIGLSYF